VKKVASIGAILAVLLGVLFLCFVIMADVERKDVLGKWCLNNGDDFLVLNEDGTYLARDSISRQYTEWALLGKKHPLGPALSINYALNGVFPLSRNAGRLIFVVDPDNNVYYSKCD
jgi:hypothetical protein